ncbi:hypothetical protein ACFVYE_15820 [Streptomyces sp. NPDC058239]|uniref:hypothetical protein n=1 Tax=unclassified Streptomyces TaxID=2593676 RepID=UPI003662D19D
MHSPAARRIAPYRVIVGGGVEESDTSREAALPREVRERIATVLREILERGGLPVTV